MATTSFELLQSLLIWQPSCGSELIICAPGFDGAAWAEALPVFVFRYRGSWVSAIPSYSKILEPCRTVQNLMAFGELEMHKVLCRIVRDVSPTATSSCTPKGLWIQSTSRAKLRFNIESIRILTFARPMQCQELECYLQDQRTLPLPLRVLYILYIYIYCIYICILIPVLKVSLLRFPLHDEATNAGPRKRARSLA